MRRRLRSHRLSNHNSESLISTGGRNPLRHNLRNFGMTIPLVSGGMKSGAGYRPSTVRPATKQHPHECQIHPNLSVKRGCLSEESKALVHIQKAVKHPFFGSLLVSRPLNFCQPMEKGHHRISWNVLPSASSFHYSSGPRENYHVKPTGTPPWLPTILGAKYGARKKSSAVGVPLGHFILGY